MDKAVLAAGITDSEVAELAEVPFIRCQAGNNVTCQLSNADAAVFLCLVCQSVEFIRDGLRHGFDMFGGTSFGHDCLSSN
mmetsp:Transcript_7555/g.14070  ORF Transcript_7555/g.14070 Transcript_7555/m.14070 type:complete len:80 (-) Transcript_7555:4629-4868(-)